MGDSRPKSFRAQKLLAVLLPLPLFPAILLMLLHGPRGVLHTVLFAPGMVMFPCVFGRAVHPFAFHIVAAMFWYVGAAALLYAVLVPRAAGRRTLFWIFIAFSALVGYWAWRLWGWNPD